MLNVTIIVFCVWWNVQGPVCWVGNSSDLNNKIFVSPNRHNDIMTDGNIFKPFVLCKVIRMLEPVPVSKAIGRKKSRADGQTITGLMHNSSQWISVNFWSRDCCPWKPSYCDHFSFGLLSCWTIYCNHKPNYLLVLFCHVFYQVVYRPHDVKDPTSYFVEGMRHFS